MNVENAPVIRLDKLVITFEDDEQIQFNNLIAFTSPGWMVAYSVFMTIVGAIVGAFLKQC